MEWPKKSKGVLADTPYFKPKIMKKQTNYFFNSDINPN